MTRTTLATIALSALIATANSSVQAIPIQVMTGTWNGVTLERSVVEPVFQARSFGFQSYDNYRWPGRLPDPGRTLITGQIPIGGHEVGDDVNLTAWQPNRVADFAHSIVNTSTTQSITSIDVNLRFYDGSRQLLGSISFSSTGAAIPPGTAALFFTQNGLGLHWYVPTEEAMFMTIQYSNAANFDISQIGLLTGGPVTSGSSSRYVQDFTTGQVIDLGSSNTNLVFFIDTIPIPVPGTAAIALTACSIGLRRRRT